MRSLSLALVAALGCAQGEPIPDGTVDPAADVGRLQQPIMACERVFSPAPELVDPTRAAGIRWSASTGCHVHIGENGIAIRLGHPRDADTGASLLGGTHYDPLENVINDNIGGDTLRLTVAHEMGHALVGHDGHSADGLMMRDATVGSQITTATLELVCTELPCAWMQPED